MTSILLVDDEKNIRITLGEILKDEGYKVTLASDGNEALEMLEKGKFNILLSDISMPGKNGLELARAACTADHRIKIILFTGKGSMENATEALRIGTFDYLLKPVKEQELLASLDRAVRVLKLDTRNSRLIKKNQKYRHKLEKKIQSQSNQLTGLSQKLLSLQDTTRDKLVHEIRERIQTPLIKISEILTPLQQEESLSPKLSEFCEKLKKMISSPPGIFQDIDPFIEESITLYEGLTTLSRALSKKTGIEIAIDKLHSPADREQRKNLYLALREAILNASRHSGTKKIQVFSKEKDATVLYTVQDNGKGIQKAILQKQEKSCSGLLLMRQRAQMAGGLFGLESVPGEGTAVTIAIEAPSF